MEKPRVGTGRIAATCVVLLVCVGVAPAAAQWKAGYAQVAITPDVPVRMAGYSSRVEPSKGLALDLFANVLVLEDADGHRAALVTTDLLGIRADIAAAIVAQVPEAAGLDASRIVISASHTHAGPALSLDDEPGPGVTPEQAAATAAYTHTLVDTIAGLIGDAAGRLAPARLFTGTGVAHFAMNRREFTPGGVILGVNPRGPVDRSVPVLRVDDADGRPRVVLFSYACHNTTLTGDNFEIGGDYAGFAQAEVERDLPGVQAMYMAGTGADANPYPRGTVEHARRHGEDLAAEVVRVAKGEMREVAGPLRVAAAPVALPLHRPTRAELDRIATDGTGTLRTTARHLLDRLGRGQPLLTEYRTPVAVWQIGADLTFVALPGEVVVDYLYAIEKAIGPLNLWVTAYANDYYGYLPSPRVLEEGGYETRGLFSSEGWFSPDTSRALVDHVRQLASQVGRPGVAP
jgi:neutral ceramidase